MEKRKEKKEGTILLEYRSVFYANWMSIDKQWELILNLLRDKNQGVHREKEKGRRVDTYSSTVVLVQKTAGPKAPRAS